MSNIKKGLLIIDPQNDYFPNGSFPLWNTENTLNTIKELIKKAQERKTPVILIQHIADESLGIAPFFKKGTGGSEIHPVIRSAAPDGIIVIKHFADSFHHTTLESVLADNGIEEILLCGMMTQNCVTHTALSKAAEKYTVKIIPDACTSVSEMVHLIALHAISSRISFVMASELF